MDFLFIAIPLPKNLKSQLERLCFGLPSIFWEEPENFQIIISQLGSTEGTLILDIKEKLKELEFPQFSLSLSGIGCTRKKGGSGVLWAGVEENPQLNKLRAAINKSLEDLPIQYDRSHIPRITLARYEKLNDQKLADYLENNGTFTSPPFTPEIFTLMISHKTPKRTVYLEQARFNLGKL